jgi:hypothetical protein
MKKEIFTIETNEGVSKFKGITFGDLWNGWECPYFTIDVVNEILNDVSCDEDTCKEYSYCYYEFDSLYNVIIEKTYWDNKIEVASTTKPILIDGIFYYPLGAYNWTWSKSNNY